MLKKISKAVSLVNPLTLTHVVSFVSRNTAGVMIHCDWGSSPDRAVSVRLTQRLMIRLQAQSWRRLRSHSDKKALIVSSQCDFVVKFDSGIRMDVSEMELILSLG